MVRIIFFLLCTILSVGFLIYEVGHQKTYNECGEVVNKIDGFEATTHKGNTDITSHLYIDFRRDDGIM